jgi:hypothetical protein
MRLLATEMKVGEVVAIDCWGDPKMKEKPYAKLYKVIAITEYDYKTPLTSGTMAYYGMKGIDIIEKPNGKVINYHGGAVAFFEFRRATPEEVATFEATA